MGVRGIVTIGYLARTWTDQQTCMRPVHDYETEYAPPPPPPPAPTKRLVTDRNRHGSLLEDV